MLYGDTKMLKKATPLCHGAEFKNKLMGDMVYFYPVKK
jgi:hypothetical protein